MKKLVFISYSHKREDWVLTRLAPLVRASAAGLDIDVEMFGPGVALKGQMEAAVDRADIVLAVICPDYLTSDPCRLEWERAHARSKRFTDQFLMPILRVGDELPPEVATDDPLWIDLRQDGRTGPDDAELNGRWELVLTAVGGTVGVEPLVWVEALTRVVELMAARQSVNLVASNPAKWRELMIAARRLLGGLPILALDDYANGHSKRGFLESLLRTLSADDSLPPEPKGADLLEFTLRVRRLQPSQLGIAHFERCWAWEDVDGALFDVLRTHTNRGFDSDRIDLTILAHSTKSIASMPDHDPVSRWQPVEVMLNCGAGR